MLETGAPSVRRYVALFVCFGKYAPTIVVSVKSVSRLTELLEERFS